MLPFYFYDVKKMKPWSIDTFRQQRPHLTTFVDTQVQPYLDHKQIVIHAPVKSGKREMIEYIAVRNPEYTHVMVSSWYRKADADQRKELEQHGVSVFNITSEQSSETCIQFLSSATNIIVHLDECDYGSGDIQSLSVLWTFMRERYTTILYSATPEEILCSPDPGISLVYTPPEGYCGPARFLQEGLIHEAVEFFQPDGLTFQGKTIIENLRLHMQHEPRRNILILRLSYSELGSDESPKDKKAFYQFLANLNYFPELYDFDIVVDKDVSGEGYNSERVEWSNSSYWDTTVNPTVVVIDQTSSRSTEWACHDRVYAMHDYRHRIRFSTVSQAQERVNHYEQRYGGFQRIHVYGSVNTFRLSARHVNCKEYYHPTWKIKKEGDLYLVCSETSLHPDCPPEGVSAERAEELTRHKKHTLSMRIRGNTKNVYTGLWLPFTPETWETEWTRIRDDPKYGLIANEWKYTRNPFRTPWKELEWKEGGLYGRKGRVNISYDGKPHKRVCCCQGVLGVVFLSIRGETSEMCSVQSMYGIVI